MVHDYKKQGKKNRISGRAFELRVRKDLEKKGWIVSKWQNNVEFNIPEKCGECTLLTGDRSGQKTLQSRQPADTPINQPGHVGRGLPSGKLIPAKHKFNPFSRALSMGTGFPDFIAYKFEMTLNLGTIVGLNKHKLYEVIGVEVKSNNTLSKIEKEKCKWLIENKIFSKILIASKGLKRGEINYEEFKAPQTP